MMMVRKTLCGELQQGGYVSEYGFWLFFFALLAIYCHLVVSMSLGVVHLDGVFQRFFSF